MIAEAAGRLPVIAAEAELALADYHLNKAKPRDTVIRRSLLGLMGLAALVLVALLWRLLTGPSL